MRFSEKNGIPKPVRRDAGVIMFIARVLILVAATTQIGFAATETHPQSLARFVTGEQSLEELIVFPDVPGDFIVHVYCRAIVSSQGQMERNFCFRSEQVEQVFRDAIDAAAKSAEVIPAELSGESQRVSLWYRVVFAKKDSKSIVRVYPNWGRDFDKYGHDYEAPQRITHGIYPSACRLSSIHGISSLESRRLRNSKLFLFFIASLTIDVDGKPTGEVVIESFGNFDPPLCRSRYERRLKSGKYIPGHQNGQPVEATYVVAVGNYKDMKFR
jgi:hypothetical protein